MSKNQTKPILPTLLLTARPAAGKSEIINFLSNLPAEERNERFHIGKMKIIDDFPFLWRWFEEDHLLTEMHQDSLFTDKNGYFKHIHLWDLLIKMINLEYEKFLRDVDDPIEYSVIIEFSRGKEHGGYQRAFPLLSDEIIEELSILYVKVPWEESLRKNRKRFNPDRPDSILEHGIPDEKLAHMYSECDFRELTEKDKRFISIHDKKVPYAVFDNEDDVTTEYKPDLRLRLEECLDLLWKNRI
ncbi:MAG: hypothetical protein Q7J07_09685 [Pelolinea sp.]|nr:hypothetical protein [Pelolinea sp.]